ncbi:MAG: hypothetical protein K940chlam1_01340 [Candidatus Anoxychlamydiales bacterium]|nr:hypothetical protein [Candidatus Anoxychlamydiales bacterium]NGX35248.1 hypothetical protein [Candidatus Anoxychlamydiales bacterium]
MVRQKIIGREKEIDTLNKIFKSKEAEFLAIYGRRRVGKTFLIREYFEKKGFFIEIIGIKDISLSQQIENFLKVISEMFFEGIQLKNTGNWMDAFKILDEKIRTIKKSCKIILFFDETPWFATRKSGFIQALDYYWNRHWSRISNLILIACGSAASWMLDHLIHAKGGLHNRLTRRILLEPFNLKETKKFLLSRSIKLKNKQILDLYMVFGGVPYYLKEIEKGKTASQIIDRTCFGKDGLLFSEFTYLFHSIFDMADINLVIIKEISKKANGISREELTRTTKISSGGTLNKRLEELEASGFIHSFFPIGKKKRDRFYRVIDEYTLFYLKWIKPLKESSKSSEYKGYWKNIIKNSIVNTWSGYAFECICLKHINEIKRALDLENIACKIGSWKFIPKKGSKKIGTQIDLLFDRNDNAITLCEIKYCKNLFLIDKSYGKSLQNKIDIFESNYKTNKQVFLAMITTEGLKKNLWEKELVDSSVELKDLFK